jgi:hypothetical protein
VVQAIDFIEGQKEEALWEELLQRCLKSPRLISDLLEHIGGNIDPIRLVRSIPSGEEIPHLRDKLVKIISDYHVQMSLREGCNAVLKSDCVALAEQLYRKRKRSYKVGVVLALSLELLTVAAAAQKVDVRAGCAACEQGLVGGASEDGVRVFACGHSFHNTCLLRSVRALRPSVVFFSSAYLPLCLQYATEAQREARGFCTACSNASSTRIGAPAAAAAARRTSVAPQGLLRRRAEGVGGERG